MRCTILTCPWNVLRAAGRRGSQGPSRRKFRRKSWPARRLTCSPCCSRVGAPSGRQAPDFMVPKGTVNLAFKEKVTASVADR